MNTIKKLTIGLLALALAGLVALPVASAQEVVDDVTVEGSGWLYAKGSGDVEIDMAGRIRLRVDGDVTIVDHAGDMRVRLRGPTDTDEQERVTNVDMIDFRGVINVKGTDFSVTVNGDVLLNAHGRGQAILVGDGVYKTRHGDRTIWDGLVRLGEPEIQPAP